MYGHKTSWVPDVPTTADLLQIMQLFFSIRQSDFLLKIVHTS